MFAEAADPPHETIPSVHPDPPFQSRPSKPCTTQELTLSYLCDLPESRGKQPLIVPPDRPIDVPPIRDFLHINNNNVSSSSSLPPLKRPIDPNDAAADGLNLSLSLNSSGGGGCGGGGPPPKRTRSVQSLVPSTSNNHSRTISDDFAASHSFYSHNPSCSLRDSSDQIYYCGEGTNGSVHSRFKPLIGGGDANHSHHSIFPSELPPAPVSRPAGSRGSDRHRSGAIGSPERVLREIVSESVPAAAQMVQQLPEEAVEAVRDHLRGIVGKEELAGLRRRLDRRADLTAETLVKSTRAQLEILVAIKTGIPAYVTPKAFSVPELVEVFTLARCRNPACKSLLPIEDCDCKICSSKKGFCSACMCPVCLEFDCALNTCSWVGCDVCSHWCHASCGLEKGLIRPGQGMTGVQFHCLGCGHASEMFGFVKDVFGVCANDWVVETMKKELDCVRRIFGGSEDSKGRELKGVAEELLLRLEKRVISASDACDAMLQYFKYGVFEFSVSGASSKDLSQITQRTADVSGQPPVPPPKITYPLNTTKIDLNTEIAHKSTHKPLQCEPSSESPFPFKTSSSKREDSDSLESIIRFKEAEARLFQSKADEARREAEGYLQIVHAKMKKLEEEYTTNLAKLCLQETEERRRKKLKELKALENSQCDYYNMKMRMQAEIASLLERMEATKQQCV
ncbi:Protein OBERON 3 [Acorus gramineus]|uniref:Protein OBERON 3 n=1 Tax=Acorus gramineus TaxID=55184 RepID=A0AAV9BML6_ACOGR|nr:Protein OBERON 3 [Acorus gramineus]